MPMDFLVLAMLQLLQDVRYFCFPRIALFSGGATDVEPWGNSILMCAGGVSLWLSVEEHN